MYSIITISILSILISFFFSKRKIEQELFNYNQTQYLKGVAILIIVLCHTIGQAKETVIATPLGGIGVAMFLFMSGYGLQESYKKNKLTGFWKKKILRIFVPYTIFITLKNIFFGSFSFKEYFLDIFFIQTSYWYIGYLIKCYIFFYLSSLFNEKYKLTILFVGSILSLFLLPQIEAEQPFSFILGVIASIKIKEIRSLSNKTILLIGIIAIIVGGMALAIKQLPLIREDYSYFLMCQILIKLPLAIGIIVLCRQFMYNNKLILLCGTYSLELYLIHMQTLHILRYDSFFLYTVYLMIFVIITIAITVIYNIICKKAINILT